MGASFPKRGDKEYIKKKIDEVFYDPKFATQELFDEVFDTVNNIKKAMATILFAKSAIRHNMRDDIKNMFMPTLLIWGQNDMETPPEVAKEFHATMPNTELHWIDECGHAAMQEKGEEFNEILIDWLNRQK